jgi:hypothetical protein
MLERNSRAQQITNLSPSEKDELIFHLQRKLHDTNTQMCQSQQERNKALVSLDQLEREYSTLKQKYILLVSALQQKQQQQGGLFLQQQF